MENQNYAQNQGQDINQSNQNRGQNAEEKDIEQFDEVNSTDPNADNASLASDGPVSKAEGDGGPDLDETGDATHRTEQNNYTGYNSADDTGNNNEDLELNPDDDPDTNLDEADLEALNGIDIDDEETMS